MLIDGRHRVEVGSSAINQTVFIRWTGNMGSNSYVWSPRRGPAVHVIADDGSFGGGDACHVRVTLCPWDSLYDSSPIRRLKEPPLPTAVSRDLWSRMVWSREPCLIGPPFNLSTRGAVSPVGLLKPRLYAWKGRISLQLLQKVSFLTHLTQSALIALGL